MVCITETRCFDNNFYQPFVWCPETSSHVNKITLRPTMHARQLHCFQLRHPDFIGPQYWPSNSPDLNPVDYAVWGILQERVYRCRIRDVDIWKNDWLQNGTDLTRTSLTELSTSGRSDCVGVSERTEDTLSIKFKRSDYLTWQQLCLLIGVLAGFV